MSSVFRDFCFLSKATIDAVRNTSIVVMRALAKDGVWKKGRRRDPIEACAGEVSEGLTVGVGAGEGEGVGPVIGHNAMIGKNCIITAKCMVGGCIIGDDVWVGPNTTFKQKIRIADGVFIGQHSNVLRDITEPYTIWAGNPARFLRKREPGE